MQLRQPGGASEMIFWHIVHRIYPSLSRVKDKESHCSAGAPAAVAEPAAWWGWSRSSVSSRAPFSLRMPSRQFRARSRRTSRMARACFAERNHAE